MNIEKYFEEMKKIQENLLDYIDYETDMEEKYQNLKNIFHDIKIHNNKFEIKSLLYLIVKISNNHHREPGFFNKIEQILKLFKDDMSKYFSNSELFHIFKSNKRLLLFLFEENIMIMDEYIVKKIINNWQYLDAKYPQYFQPEFQPFLDKEWFPKHETNEEKWVKELKKELPSDFYEKRKIGENDDEICKLIQKDLIEEFIIYINKNFYSVNSTIIPSIYETNKLLLKFSDIPLIEYAVFFGSNQIFNYLSKNGAKSDSLLWYFAVHGQNAQIINSLEENKILTSAEGDEDEQISFERIFVESIKCHHIDVINYIQSNYLQNEKEYLNDTSIDCFKYYNFMFMQFDVNNENLFFYSCKYDYCFLVLILLKKIDLDINKKIIYVVIFYSIFKSKISITFKTIFFNKI